MRRTIPLWLHGLLRILLPLPCALAVTAPYVWGCITLLSNAHFHGRGWVVLGSVILGFAVFALGWQSPLWLLRTLPVPCTACGHAAHLEPIKGQKMDYRCGTGGMRFNSHWDAGKLIGGIFSAGMGFTCLTFAFLVPTTTELLGLIVLLLAGLSLVSLGVALIGQKPLWNLLAARMPWMNRVPWGTIAGGGIATLIGVTFICAGIFSKDESNMPSGRGAVVGAGAAFALAGLCILLPLIGDYVKVIPHKVIQRLGLILAFCLLLSFAVVPALIALHDAGTPAAHPVPYISAGIIIALIGVIIYVYIRDRKKKKQAILRDSAEISEPESHPYSPEK